jgi:hypothetical protein
VEGCLNDISMCTEVVLGFGILPVGTMLSVEM